MQHAVGEVVEFAVARDVPRLVALAVLESAGVGGALGLGALSLQGGKQQRPLVRTERKSNPEARVGRLGMPCSLCFVRCCLNPAL